MASLRYSLKLSRWRSTPSAFTKDPYMLTFDVEKDDLAGWTGKNAAPVKKAVPKKKAN